MGLFIRGNKQKKSLFEKMVKKFLIILACIDLNKHNDPLLRFLWISYHGRINNTDRMEDSAVFISNSADGQMMRGVVGYDTLAKRDLAVVERKRISSSTTWRVGRWNIRRQHKRRRQQQQRLLI